MTKRDTNLSDQAGLFQFSLEEVSFPFYYNLDLIPLATSVLRPMDEQNGFFLTEPFFSLASIRHMHCLVHPANKRGEVSSDWNIAAGAEHIVQRSMVACAFVFP